MFKAVSIFSVVVVGEDTSTTTIAPAEKKVDTTSSTSTTSSSSTTTTPPSRQTPDPTAGWKPDYLARYAPLAGLANEQDPNKLRSCVGNLSKNVPDEVPVFDRINMASLGQFSGTWSNAKLGAKDKPIQAVAGVLTAKGTEAEEIFVAFKGSSKATEVLQEIDWLPGMIKEAAGLDELTDTMDGIPVVPYFYESANEIYSSVKGAGGKTLKDYIKDLTAAHPNAKVVFTGHSLGGAHAHLAAYFFKKTNPESKAMVVTFGQPRVGGYKYVDACDKLNIEAYRVVHYTDTAPHWPMCRQLTPFFKTIFEIVGHPDQDARHHGVEVWFNKPQMPVDASDASETSARVSQIDSKNPQTKYEDMQGSNGAMDLDGLIPVGFADKYNPYYYGAKGVAMGSYCDRSFDRKLPAFYI